MDGELNMVIGEKKEGNVILLYLPAHTSLSALMLPLWRTNGVGRWKPYLDVLNVSFPYY